MRLSMLCPTPPHPGSCGATLGNLIRFDICTCPVGGEFHFKLRMRSCTWLITERLRCERTLLCYVWPSSRLALNFVEMELVCLNENRRVVSFSTPETSAVADAAHTTDVERLTQAIRVSFNNVLQPGQEFFLQVKNEEWEGVFLDLLEDKDVTDWAVFKAVLKPVTEVSRLAM